MNSTGFFTDFELEYTPDDNPEVEICLSGSESANRVEPHKLTAFMSVRTLDHLYVQIARKLAEVNALPKPEPTPESDSKVTALRRRIYRDAAERQAIADREVS